jgi:hypothetical protein
MNDELRHYHASLQAIVATAVGQNLTVRQLMDGLLNQAAAVLVSSSVDRKELEAAVEIARHELDTKVTEYDRRAGYAASR